MRQRSIFILLLLIVNVISKKLPSYIVPCPRNHPELEKCIIKTANQVIPLIAPRGDPEYKVPVADPLFIEYLEFNPGKNSRVNFRTRNLSIQNVGVTNPRDSAFSIKIAIKNATVTGLKNAEMRDVRYNFYDEKQHTEYYLFVPKVNIKSKYKASGKVLLLPITGDGIATMEIENITCSFVFDNTLTTREDGLSYATPINPSFKMSIGKFRIHLSNMFNGNKLLGDNMNLFLNENWSEVFKEIEPTISDAMGVIFVKTLTNIFDLVSIEDALPEKELK